jgi:hypothetical protein
MLAFFLDARDVCLPAAIMPGCGSKQDHATVCFLFIVLVPRSSFLFLLSPFSFLLYLQDDAA